MLPGETSWDLDQRLKITIREANITSTRSLIVSYRSTEVATQLLQGLGIML